MVNNVKDNKQTRSLSVKSAIFLCVVVAVYSMSGFFTKLASSYDFLTFPYIACLLGVVVVLGLYAVLWQTALKRIPLSQAYPFRSLSVVFGLGIAYFAFHENVTWKVKRSCHMLIRYLFI